MLNALVSKLPKYLQSAAKSVVAGVGLVAVAVAHGLITGEWDQAAIDGGVAVVIAGLVYGTANQPKSD